MRFKLFGGADCSDMFLAQFVPVVNLPPNELRTLALKVVQLTCAADPDKDRDEIFSGIGLVGAPSSSSSSASPAAPSPSPSSSSSSSSSSLSITELPLACCAIHTILSNVATYDIDVQQTSRELVILGLSSGAADVLAEVAATHRSALLGAMAPTVRMAPTAARLHLKRDQEAEDDYLVVMDKRSGDGSSSVVNFSASGDMLRSLLGELMTAREALQS